MSFNNQVVNELASFLKIPNSLEMFFQIGLGKIQNKDLREFIRKRSGGIYGYLRSKFYYKPPKVHKEKETDEKTANKFLVFG